MPKGERFKEPLKRFRDPVTGQPMIRVNDPAVHCHHPYFYFRMFTPDSKKLLYTSHRDGPPNACLVDIESGESVQLTGSSSMDGFLLSLSPDGKALFFSEGKALKRLEIATLEEKTVYELKPPYDGSPVYPGYSADCTKALVCQMHRDDVVRGEGGWDFFAPQCEARPRCRLVLVDLESGAESVVLEESCWLGHPQIHPTDSSLLMYCHEGPAKLIDCRIWLIGADGKGKRPVKVARKEKEGAATAECVTHEYFTPDGKAVICAYYTGEPGVKGHVLSLELPSLAVTDLGPFHYSHMCHSPDSRFMVGDESLDSTRESNCVCLFDVERREARPLCLHGSSFKPRGKSTQDAHPHPAFSPDARLVAFSSDRETSPDGNCIVYLASTEGLLN